MAWASDPGDASSIAVVFTLSFFYYFIGFRQLYIRISSLPIPLFKNKATANEFKDAYDVIIDLEKHYNNLHEINTVELPNNGHIGSGSFVLYIEVVPL